VVLNVDVGAVRVAALVVPLRLGVQARPRAQEAAYVLRKLVRAQEAGTGMSYGN
jgi:hypothetical protein